MSLLEVEKLTKRFGGLLAVSDLSFVVNEGEIVAIIGPNGAGKTTTFNLISGLLAPDSGKIRFRGVDVTYAPPHERCRAGIGRTFQLMQPFAELSVLENVMVGGIFGTREKRSLASVRKRAAELCELVGLGERMDDRPEDLTVADLKRLEVARALAAEPKLLLLDEVMGGLTPVESAAAVGLVRRVRDEGVTVLLIDHVMSSVKDLSDRVIVMNYGQELAAGTYEEIASDPRVIEAYLGQNHLGQSHQSQSSESPVEEEEGGANHGHAGSLDA